MIFVTGCAGFIGSYVVKALCLAGRSVIGIDNLNDYYDVRLKEWRLDNLKHYKNFTFIKGDIEDKEAMSDIFRSNRFDAVINLAARAGVGASLKDPFIYATTNIVGNLNLLEMCRKYNVEKFVLASTSSLYAGKEMPFKEEMSATTPTSPYAATKSAAEVMSYTYHYLYGIDVSVLRFFTVYGPAGRPDMSIFRFIKWAMEGRPVEVNGDGTQSRDFTYVEDIAEGAVAALKKVGHEIINLGGNSPHSLIEVISLIENTLDKKVKVTNKPFPREDVKATWANIDKAKTILNWSPRVSLSEGLNHSIEWARDNQFLVSQIRI